MLSSVLIIAVFIQLTAAQVKCRNSNADEADCIVDIESEMLGLESKFLKQKTGPVVKKSVQCDTPTVRHRVDLAGGVSAVTTLGDEVFARKRNEAAIRVYDAATLAFKRSLSVPGLGSQNNGVSEEVALVASNRDNCLYVSDMINDKIWKVQLPNGPVTMQWNVGESPRGLAINRAQNLIVNVIGEDKIKEYARNGSLVRQVSVPESFYLGDVVELPNGHLLVSNSVMSRNSPKLAVFDVEGTLVRSYVGDSVIHGSGFAVFENGFIIAANDHIMMIVNPTLTSVHSMSLSGSNPAFTPYRVAIDESRGRAYVGEFMGSRLYMLENVFGRCLAF